MPEREKKISLQPFSYQKLKNKRSWYGRMYSFIFVSQFAKFLLSHTHQRNPLKLMGWFKGNVDENKLRFSQNSTDQFFFSCWLLVSFEGEITKKYNFFVCWIFFIFFSHLLFLLALRLYMKNVIMSNSCVHTR